MRLGLATSVYLLINRLPVLWIPFGVILHTLRDASPTIQCGYPQTAGVSLSPAGQVSSPVVYNHGSCDFPFVVAYSDQCTFRQQLWFEITQPEVFAKAVAGNRFDAAVFLVGIGVVDCAVDKVI